MQPLSGKTEKGNVNKRHLHLTSKTQKYMRQQDLSHKIILNSLFPCSCIFSLISQLFPRNGVITNL